MPQSRNTLRQAAIELLQELGPTHYRKLTDKILIRGIATSSAEKPENVLNKIMSTDVSHRGTQSKFIRLGPGVYGLRALHVAGRASEDKVGESRTRKTDCPLLLAFPADRP